MTKSDGTKPDGQHDEEIEQIKHHSLVYLYKIVHIFAFTAHALAQIACDFAIIYAILRSIQWMEGHVSHDYEFLTLNVHKIIFHVDVLVLLSFVLFLAGKVGFNLWASIRHNKK
ncbi:hypothetical protein [Rhodopseudomonas palustris]|uniref:hypothetical protein n=1 Tax=Rhodopseudomonas palustris TaxID=1076 RepID=UPI0005A0091F|nr:hypothetical protein [Rhodopseudomonas palustris]